MVKNTNRDNNPWTLFPDIPECIKKIEKWENKLMIHSVFESISNDKEDQTVTRLLEQFKPKRYKNKQFHSRRKRKVAMVSDQCDEPASHARPNAHYHIRFEPERESVAVSSRHRRLLLPRYPPNRFMWAKMIATAVTMEACHDRKPLPLPNHRNQSWRDSVSDVCNFNFNDTEFTNF